MTDRMFPKYFWTGKGLFVLAALAAMLGGAPRALSCDLAPATAAPADDSLRTLVASLDLTPKTPHAVARPDPHAVRTHVACYSVRLAVDKSATHPLAGPVAVDADHHLGDPGRHFRLVSLAALDPPAPAPAKPVAATPTPMPSPVAVKKTTPPAPTPHAAKAPAPRHVAGIAPGRSVLVAGDSLSIFLASALRPMLAGRPGTTFAARGKVSSGLAQPGFFDWEREMAALATSGPDTVVIMIAANDNKTMTRPDGAKVAFGRAAWNAEYARRVRRLVALARSHNPAARVYWVGAPVMADHRLNTDVAAINAVIAKTLADLPDCRFVDVWRTLADASGHYAKVLPAPGGARTARTPDGVHLTAYGAKLLANAALTAMSPAVAQLDRP